MWDFVEVWISLFGFYADYVSLFPAEESQPMCQQLDDIKSQLNDLKSSVSEILAKIRQLSVNSSLNGRSVDK
jgi:hypothetical protein